MDLVTDTLASKKNQQNKQQQKNNVPGNNASNLLLGEQWKSQQDFKRQIISLEIQNQKYRNQLYQLGETVNKILDKVKVSSKTAVHTPNLQQQLQLVKKQLHNVNQFIQIYQKQLAVLNNKKKKEQVQNIANTEEILKNKTQELNHLKKQVKELSHRNKALEYRLLEYSKKGKTKSIDQQTMQLKELINQNKNLKIKLQQLEALNQKKQKWLQNNIESAKQLEKKVQEQQTKLPRIQSHKTIQRQRQKNQSLPKLQSQKKIYTKWLQSATNVKKNDVIEKQLAELQKINKIVQQKITNTSSQINQIEAQIEKIKQRIVEQQQRENQIDQNSPNKTTQIERSIPKTNIEEHSISKQKKKHVGTMVVKRMRKIRKDWVGKFDGIRFSDNRFIREECRLYKVLFNTNGYCQFFYYSWKDQKKRFNSKLPFETSSLASQGKDSAFTVQSPDFIKNIRLKINLKTHRITQIAVISNLGIEAEFVVDTNLHSVVPGIKNVQKLTTNTKQEQPEVNYEMDIKPNEAITCIFGSYGVKMDEKKQITHVWLEGLGVEMIEDFVEELI